MSNHEERTSSGANASAKETNASAKESNASAKEANASAKDTNASAKESNASAKDTNASPKESSASAKEASPSAEGRPAEGAGPQPTSPGPQPTVGTAASPVEKPLISIDDFARLDLRVARVLEVAPHPNAERLLLLQIDLGDERRQLVAGLAQHYSPDDLIGEEIVIVANLKPAKLRGEMSQGMLLAATDDDGVAILTPRRPVAPGSRVG